MPYSVKNIEELEDLNELVLLHEQVIQVRLQDKLVKQNFHENVKKIYESLTDTIENTSRDISKTITEILLKTTKQFWT